MCQVQTSFKISEENNSDKSISNPGKMKQVTVEIKVYRNNKKKKKETTLTPEVST
jgi:hypothetical protein